jgi:hypothetical protein
MDFLFDSHRSAGARVLPGPSRSASYRESAEAPYLDAIATRQRGDDLAENGVDDVLHVTLIEMRVLVDDTPDEPRFDHRGRSHLSQSIKLAKGHELVADSDEVARAFRDDAARRSDIMSPGSGALAGG